MSISDLLPPSDDRAEMALLGALTQDNDKLGLVGSLQSQDFSDPLLGRIFLSLATRVTSGLSADAASLKADFEVSSLLEEVGGTAFIDQLVSMSSTVDVPALATRVRDLWQRRQLLLLHEEKRQDAEDGVLAAHSITSRMPAQQLVELTVARLAGHYAVAKAILNPTPEVFACPPGGIGRLTMMATIELAELAEHHENRAVEFDAAGDRSSAQARRDRAEQLRAMLGEMPA